ncbi:MAG: hypothetical protein LN412_03945 [Candidatus Thermoplasmatota archaeon]|nr:hypothetical protein [Candidatus Thermoplasmatota archaeon]
MLRREVAISPADVSLLRSNVSKLGGYALGLLDNLDLGIEKATFKEHLQRTKQQLDGIAEDQNLLSVALRPRGYTDRGLIEETNLPWNYPQTLRFATGACMISQKYFRWMRQENIGRSIAAKVLYKCQTGILDDLIDKGDYNYLEAKDLYHLVLSSMTDPSLDPNTFMKRLISILSQEQLPLFDTIVAITSNFNLLFTLSPHGSDLFNQMETLDERVALGQALTMFEKEQHLDLGQVASISRNFHSLEEGIPWYERLASYVSGGTRYNLIDISFLERKLKKRRLESFMNGWHFFDIIIVFLNNIVSVYEDLRDGIANLSLVAMREKDVLPLNTLKGYDPGLALKDYEGHLLRLAKLASKGLDGVLEGFPDPEQYYPFIAVMMPVVMLADWIGKNDDMIILYLESLAPSIRKAVERSSDYDREKLQVPWRQKAVARLLR